MLQGALGSVGVMSSAKSTGRSQSCHETLTVTAIESFRLNETHPELARGKYFLIGL